MKVWARSSDAGRTGPSGRSESRASGAPGGTADAAASEGSPLEEALRQAQAMRWQYNVAQTELDRLRRELSTAQAAREQQDARREALVEAVADSVPSAMRNSRRQGWDEGWEAAKVGLPKHMNPHRDSGGAGAAPG